MNIYDQVKEVYDNSELYNNEFANYDDDFTFLTRSFRLTIKASQFFYFVNKKRL